MRKAASLPAFVILFAFILSAVPFSAAHASMGTQLQVLLADVARWPALVAAASYTFGIFLAVLGIGKLYEHVQSPNQVSVFDGLKRIGAAAALFSLPIVLEAVQAMMADGGVDTVFGNVSGATSGAGLDEMMKSFMEDMHAPLVMCIYAFSYFAGLVLVVIGIMRLLKTAQDGPRGPGGIGTIMTFIVAGALLSVDRMMGAWSSSLFGTEDVTIFANLAYTGDMTAAEIDHVHAVISTILMFMTILGWISFVRGWFILRDVAEGSHNASLMAGMTHLFGGALAVNLGPLINAVQDTLGLSAYGVNFS